MRVVSWPSSELIKVEISPTTLNWDWPNEHFGSQKGLLGVGHLPVLHSPFSFAHFLRKNTNRCLPHHCSSFVVPFIMVTGLPIYVDPLGTTEPTSFIHLCWATTCLSSLARTKANQCLSSLNRFFNLLFLILFARRESNGLKRSCFFMAMNLWIPLPTWISYLRLCLKARQ